jgi:hypothetical protein
MAVCETFNPRCYGCRLRQKGVSVSPAATPSRRNTKPSTTFAPRNSWERGVAGEHRPDGSFMPLLDASGQSLGLKEYGERRREVDAQVARLKTAPAAAGS